MTKTVTKVPQEIAEVLAGRNPFLHYSHASEVFRDVFDMSTDGKKSEEEAAGSNDNHHARQKSRLPQHMTMVKQTRESPQPQHGSWKWDTKLGFLFVPKDQEYADARNGTRDFISKRETVKVAEKLQYKHHRHPTDRIIEGFATLLKDKQINTDVIIDEKRQVELEDIKRGAIHLTKYTLHNKISDTVHGYYDTFNCVRGLRQFIQQEVYDKFLLALIHYFYFYLLGLTQKHFRLTIKAGCLFRLPGQTELPRLIEREHQRRVFRYQIHTARVGVAKRYTALLLRILEVKQAEPGSIKYKPHPIVPERFFFESLLDITCLGICVTFLQRSNRLIRAEFGRLFRREAFNMDSLERTIEFTDYETYSARALHAIQHTRQAASERSRSIKMVPKLSPRSYRLMLSDELVKSTKTNWSAKVAKRPSIWKMLAKTSSHPQKPSAPDKKDYPTHKHRIATEMRDDLLHTVPGSEANSLMAQLRRCREPARKILRSSLIPFHMTLGILGKQLKLFDYWTLLLVMNKERKLTLPGLTKEARFRAFKTVRLLFPRKVRASGRKNMGSPWETVKAKTKLANLSRKVIAKAAVAK